MNNEQLTSPGEIIEYACSDDGKCVCLGDDSKFFYFEKVRGEFGSGEDVTFDLRLAKCSTIVAGCTGENVGKCAGMVNHLVVTKGLMVSEIMACIVKEIKKKLLMLDNFKKN